jgi:site-specific DNA-methyltransferase (adenine-specific)
VIELNNIYNENCIEFMKRLNVESVSVDVIVTSPPYNLNKEYGSYKDNKERKEYLNWLYEIAQLSYLNLKDNGSFFLNIGGTPSDPILPFEVVDKFRKAGYKLQNTIHWIKSISFEKEDIGKNNGIRDDYSIGHFKPIISERFLTDLHEYIFHLTKI